MAEQRVRASRGGGSDVRGQVVQTWGKARAVVHLTSSPLPHRSKALLNSDVLPYAPPPFPSQDQGTHIKYSPSHGPVVPERCPETGSGWIMGGPIWSDPIHDIAFVRGVIADMDRDKER